MSTDAEKIAALVEALERFVDLAGESRGVDGYHLNGDIATWDEFDIVQQAEDALALAKYSFRAEHRLQNGDEEGANHV